MAAEDKKPLHPEVTFLPPLEMILSSFDPDERKKVKDQDVKRNKTEETSVVKLIEKLENEKQRP